MDSFKKQIDEDLADYAEKYPNIKDMSTPEWAFNFWVLDKLFSVDEDMIESQILDRHDKGIDCYVWHEDTHDLYLIQNKYLSKDTKLDKNYIIDDVLSQPIISLDNNTYNRSKDLQEIYNRYSDLDDFYIYFYIYATNNESKTESINEAIATYNKSHAVENKEAKFFSLDDIEETYFKEPITAKKSFDYTIKTINKGTILNVDNNAYGTNLIVDAKYVLTPILTVFDLYSKARNEGYSLFSENIREYLGSAGTVNKKIKATLNNPEDRNNFFFYNNGITMIVDDMCNEQTAKGSRMFDVINPQIVNGCQTVSTIWETLSALPINSLEQDFKNVYIMIKILKIPVGTNEEKYKELYYNIVKYNNSQNSIPVKSFVANEGPFSRVQTEFATKGILVCVKQSDNYKYKEMYAKPSKLKEKNMELLNRFGLEDLNKTTDFIVSLENVLQVFLAFVSTPYNATQKKAYLLKQGSAQYEMVTDFITSATSNEWILLYLLYLKVEISHNKKDKKKYNPFYFIYCFSRYECKGDADKILTLLSTKEQVSDIINKYTKITARYYIRWTSQNQGMGYNDMIKSQVDTEMLDEIVAIYEAEEAEESD